MRSNLFFADTVTFKLSNVTLRLTDFLVHNVDINKVNVLYRYV